MRRLLSRGHWFNVGLAVLWITTAAAADEVRRWRDPQGREHVTIVGDETPTVEEDFSASESSGADRMSIDTSLRRREIEKRLLAATDRLGRKREEIDRTEKTKYEVAKLPTPVEPEERRRVEDLRRNAILGADAFAAEKRRRLFHLRRDERAILNQLGDHWRDLDRLRDEIRAYYGRLPHWWNDRLRCPGCPTPEEIAKALSQNEVEVVTAADPTPTP